jgi:helix-turn-helix protein
MNTTTTERKAIVDKANKKLSITKQCNLLAINRSGYYYVEKEENGFNNELMLEIDKEYTAHPFRGVPSMTEYLRKDLGYPINKKRVERLYKLRFPSPIQIINNLGILFVKIKSLFSIIWDNYFCHFSNQAQE